MMANDIGIQNMCCIFTLDENKDVHTEGIGKNIPTDSPQVWKVGLSKGGGREVEFKNRNECRNWT